MRTWVSVALAALVLVLAVGAGQAVRMPRSSACTQVAPFEVTPDDLLRDDFNQPAGLLATNFREEWGERESPASIMITGGYVIETVHTLEPEDQWTRGSVSSVVTTWGDSPPDLGPFLHETVDLATAIRDTCGEPSDGPVLGTREVHLVSNWAAQQVTNGKTWPLIYRFDTETEATEALTAAFGEAVVVDRDLQAEELMLAKLGNTRSGSGRGIAIAFGVTLIVGCVLSYRYRKRRLLAQWEHLTAEQAADEARKLAEQSNSVS